MDMCATYFSLVNRPADTVLVSKKNYPVVIILLMLVVAEFATIFSKQQVSFF